MLVGLLTIEQKDSLIGHSYEGHSYFNPVQDLEGNWIISTQEIDLCNNTDFDWIKSLPLIEFTGHFITMSGNTN